ncbi:hypothetical protein [Thiolapillus sp.]|uniref:hypothetical protein n=1 Tax=Thiolapillus sp. TaxID=2017437 RepID=UPI003AF9390A
MVDGLLTSPQKAGDIGVSTGQYILSSVSLPRDRFWDIPVPYMVSSRFARLNNPNDRDKIASIYPACLRRM